MKIKAFTLTAALAVTTVSSGAVAATKQASNWLPTSYPQSQYGYVEMFDRIKKQSNAGLNFEVHYGGSLLPAKTTISGLRDGVADVGIVYPGYTPAELPIQAFLNSAAFVAEDSLAVALAYTEMNLTHPALLAEWDKFNAVFTGAYATPLYHMMCNTEISTLDQAKGKRMRTAGSAFTALSDSLGATGVSVPIGDAYSGMQRGSLDCIIADPTNLIAASFNEVVTDITVDSLGVVTGANWVFNKDSWKSFSDKDRALLIDEMALAITRIQVAFDRLAKESLADAESRGIKLHKANQDLKSHIDGFKRNYIEELVAGATSIKNPQTLLDEYTQLQKAWDARLAKIDRTDEQAVTALVRELLVSKLAQ